jgi:hypothetical protein
MSSDVTDAGYAAYEAVNKDKHRVDVYLDGIKQRYVVTADVEAGYIKRYKLNNKGSIYPDKDGEPITVEDYGKVEIVLADV